jgi:hypothetical protein
MIAATLRVSRIARVAVYQKQPLQVIAIVPPASAAWQAGAGDWQENCKVAATVILSAAKNLRDIV